MVVDTTAHTKPATKTPMERAIEGLTFSNDPELAKLPNCLPLQNPETHSKFGLEIGTICNICEGNVVVTADHICTRHDIWKD
jgi:hypothetical protein